MTIEEIAEMAQRGEDVSSHFTGNFRAKQRVSVDFPLELLRSIDVECCTLGISRQLWIQRACTAQLHEIRQDSHIYENGLTHTH
ncbi:MAG: hypothetical protein DYG89_36815 [Caldilinea sp. CFX5]|nr:hypothetical protein [Caldilinea sp. CFX5]